MGMTQYNAICDKNCPANTPEFYRGGIFQISVPTFVTCPGDSDGWGPGQVGNSQQERAGHLWHSLWKCVCGRAEKQQFPTQRREFPAAFGGERQGSDASASAGVSQTQRINIHLGTSQKHLWFSTSPSSRQTGIRDMLLIESWNSELDWDHWVSWDRLPICSE